MNVLGYWLKTDTFTKETFNLLWDYIYNKMKLLYMGKFSVSFTKQSETNEMSIINVLPRK